VRDKHFSRLSFLVALAFTPFMCASNLVFHRTSVPCSMFLDHLDLFRSNEYSKFESIVSFGSWLPSVDQHGFRLFW
jgi:hypothetical protein